MTARLVLTLVLLSPTGIAPALDTLTFRYAPFIEAPRRTVTATGQTLVEDSAGNRFFETVDGARYLIAGDDVLSSSSDEEPFAPATHDAMGERLLAELPTGFRLHTTKHYVIAYDTSREYAEWVSSLLEGLQKALVRYWKRAGVDLHDPEFPLPIVVYRTAAAYNAACRADGAAQGAIGYYHMGTNRVRMYDLTGADSLRNLGGARRGSRAEISRMLSTPIAEPLVATIVHEATHQVCYNTGLMQRYADLPIWYVEGMAVYFEAPKAGSSRGWRGIGQVNHRRLATFRRNLPKWNLGRLPSLIGSDKALRDPRTGGEAYADAWALNYYLIKKRPKDYTAYVQMMSEREPLQGPPPDEPESVTTKKRLEDFEEHFGPILELQPEMLRAMSRL